MDHDRFDDLSRSLGKPESRRTAVATIAALVGLGALAPHELDAKKKKKKPSNCKLPSTCKPLNESCNTACDCRGDLDCDEGDCCKKNGGDCQNSGDCCGTLVCRAGQCEPCRSAGQSCTGVEECCAAGPPFLGCPAGFCVV